MRRLVEVKGRAYEVRWDVAALKGGTMIGRAQILHDGEVVATLREPADLWAVRHTALDEGFITIYPQGDTTSQVGTCIREHYPAAIEAVKLALKGGGDAC